MARSWRQHEQRRAKGQAEPPPPSADEQAVRNRAILLINCHGNVADFLPPPASREAALRIEISALDMVIETLGRREISTRAADTIAWEAKHGGEWTSELRDWVMTALHLQAVEQRIAALKASRGPFPLPLDRYFATRTPLAIAWQTDPLAGVLKAALAEGIISKRDLEAADV